MLSNFTLLKSIFVRIVLWCNCCNGLALLPSGAFGVTSDPCISLLKAYNWKYTKPKKKIMIHKLAAEKCLLELKSRYKLLLVLLCKLVYSERSTRRFPNSLASWCCPRMSYTGRCWVAKTLALDVLFGWKNLWAKSENVSEWMHN